MDGIEAMVQFGVAGLMGVLWVWERTHSRKRERQLSETHGRLIARDREIGTLVKLVRQNTRALIGFERGQQRMCELLEGISHDLRTK